MARRPQNNKSSKRAVKSAKTRLTIVQMRLEGKSFLEIAAKLGVSSKGGVYKHLMNALKEWAEQSKDIVEKLKERDFAITEAMLETWVPLAISGCDKAAGVVIKILVRRACYYGLDAPTKANVSVTGDSLPFEGTKEQMAAAICWAV